LTIGLQQSVELIRLIRRATELSIIEWTESIGYCYNGTLDTRLYTISWLYWYDKRGITIDQQGHVVSVNNFHTVLLNGTNWQQESELLLASIDNKWAIHFESLIEGSLSILNSFEELSPPNRNHSFLTLLNALLSATNRGLIHWQRQIEQIDTYTANLDGRALAIRFLQPIDSEEKELGKIVARLTANGVSCDFVVGTEGFGLVEQILACSITEMKDRLSQREEIVQQEVNFLVDVMKDQG